MEIKSLLTNHAKIVGRKNLHPYVIGSITGAMKLDFTSDETLELIAEIIQTMHEVIDDQSLPWDTEKAPTAMGADSKNREITRVNYTTGLSRIAPLVDRVWAMEVLEKEEILRGEC